MTFETPEDILEHFGVKGMRWGVRKQRTSTSDSGKTDARKRNAKRIAAGAAVVAAGGILAAVLIKQHGNQTAPQASKEVTDTIARFLNANKNVRVESTPKPMMVKTRTDPKALIDLQDRIEANTRAANVDLMRWYERSQTPFPQRQYLPDPPARNYSQQVRKDAANMRRVREETAAAKRKAQESLAPSLKRAKQNRRRI